MSPARPAVKEHVSSYILIVEDDLDLLEALQLELEGRGYAVKTARHGAEALALVREAPPLLIVTDLEMPVMNGRKMLQLLRAEPYAQGVPVLILSAFGYEWEAELMGAQGFIRKPVRAAQLEQEIARVLAERPPRSAVLLN